MPNEVDNKNEGGGLNRRNFLKSAGAAVAGGTLSAGLTLSPGPADAAVPAAPAPRPKLRGARW